MQEPPVPVLLELQISIVPPDAPTRRCDMNVPTQKFPVEAELTATTLPLSVVLAEDSQKLVGGVALVVVLLTELAPRKTAMDPAPMALLPDVALP